MKLANYAPTGRWVLCFAEIEDKVGGIFLPENSRTGEGGLTPKFRVIAVGPQVETVEVGERVVIEVGSRIMEVRFEDCMDDQPVCFLEYAIIGKYQGQTVTFV